MTELFYYGGAMYPDYIRRGNAMQFIEPVARQFCTGRGLDIGGGKWPLPGAILVDQTMVGNGEHPGTESRPVAFESADAAMDVREYLVGDAVHVGHAVPA